MAELPRYRPLGVNIPSMPSVNFVQTGSVLAQKYSNIDDALGKISDYLYKKDVSRVQKEAAQHAFENPVSPEAVRNAIASGTLSEVVGDTDTVFGAVTTATTAAQLRVKLANEVSKKANEYAIAAQTGTPIDTSQMQTDLASMIEGHQSLIAQLSPDDAIQYSATANTYASTAYKIALEEQLKMNQVALKDDALMSVDGLGGLLENAYTIYAGDDEALLNEIGGAVGNVNANLMLTGDAEFIEAQRKDMMEIHDKALSNVLVRQATSSEEAFSNALNGDFGEHKSKLYNALPIEDQLSIKDAMRKEMKSIREERKTNEDNQLDDYKNQSQQLQIELQNIDQTKPRFGEIFTELENIAIASDGEAITAKAIADLKKSYEEGEPVNQAGELALRIAIMNEEILTTDDLLGKAKVLGVPAKQVIEVLPLLNAEEKAQAAYLHKEAMNFAKIVPGSQSSGTQSQAYYAFTRKVESLHRQQVEAWERGGAEGPRPTLKDAVNEYSLSQRTDLQQDKIDGFVKQIADYIGQDGSVIQLNIDINEHTTEDQIRDAAEAAGFSDKDIAQAITFIRGPLAQIKMAVDMRDSLGE